MTTDGPEAESRNARPQLRTSLANRDKPLFTGRRPPLHLQQRSDFFTDSLNTSYIPSPSPTAKTSRAATGSGARSTPPRVIGKQPSTTFRAASESKTENKPPSSPSTNGRRRNQHSRKASAVKPSTRVASSSPATTNPHHDRASTRTPSPSRGRQAEDPISPTSESSPPRGLAEAYRRIEDEEYLAGREDDSLDDLEYSDDVSGRVEGLDEAAQEVRRRSSAPSSKRNSRRISSQELLGEIIGNQERQSNQEQPHHSSDEDSTLSHEAGAREDTFDRVLTQYNKDEQRVRDVLGGNVQPFRKAMPRDRSGLTVENLQRKDASSKQGSSPQGSSPSVSSKGSKGSDPSLNIPQNWGRKGRGSNTWLSRISQESGKLTGDKSNTQNARPAQPTGKEENASSGAIVDWIAAASEVPLPSVENDSLQIESASKRSTPASHLKRQTSSDRIRRWEFLDDDFTARSLQVSDSPPIRLRNGALNVIREREIENLEKSAVTTNKLRELKEQKSLERVRIRSPSLTRSAIAEERDEEISNGPARRASSRSSLPPHFEAEELEGQRNEAQHLTEDGGSKSDAPVLVTEKPPSDNDNGESSTKLVEKPVESRPSHQRQDSRDLLRQLARATSASPRPSPAQPKEESKEPTDTQEHNNGISQQITNISSLLAQDILASETAPSSRSSGVDLRIEKKPSLDLRVAVQATPQQSKQPHVYLKTPLVTGAWIDTPLPTGGRGPPMPTPEIMDDEEESPLVISTLTDPVATDTVIISTHPVPKQEAPVQPPLAETAPVLPKSALTAIIEKAKSSKQKRQTAGPTEPSDDTLILDDSTIQSLEELLASSDTEQIAILTPPTSPSRKSRPIGKPSPQQKPAELNTAKTSSHELEAGSYDHLNSRLSRLGISIRDAKKGIDSLEKAVVAVPARSTQLSSGEECNEAGEFHDFIWPCERCGCPGRDVSVDWQPIRIRIPRLWTWEKEDWRPRLTWLGMATMIAWALVIVESLLQHFYSPPFFAERVDGYGIEYNAPRPPFILSQLLWKSALGVPFQWLWFMTGVFVRFLSGIFGFSAGWFDWNDDWMVQDKWRWRFREVGPPVRDEGLGWGADTALGSDEYLR